MSLFALEYIFKENFNPEIAETIHILFDLQVCYKTIELYLTINLRNNNFK
jgi:hypothetical protein